MLLDRRKIRRWAKWVALALAIVFVLSFLFLGVGYGGAGFNISAIFTEGGCSSKSTATTNPVDQRIAAYLETLKTNPKDKDAIIGLANIYQQLADSGQGDTKALLTQCANYLQQYIDADPTQIDVYLRLAKLYMGSTLSDNQSAVNVLNKAVEQAPNNPDVFLQLGVAQRGAGNKSAAVMAWQRYLELAPNGDQAAAVKEGIAQLSQTTTTVASTTTTAGSTSTTTGSATTTTTAAPATTTTAP